jgi:hypothetical protein
MRKITITTLAALLCFAGVAHADHAACWGNDSRGDITCIKITEQLLLSLRGQTIEAVRNALKAPGRSVDETGLHFLSNYSRGEKAGSGDVHVTFEDGRATAVNASVDSPGKAGQFEFIWNAYAVPALGSDIDRTTRDFRRTPFCSDFSGKPSKCQGDDTIDHQLTLSQMQGSLTKADLLKELEMSCNPGQGLIVSDPRGDCARLRERLR